MKRPFHNPLLILKTLIKQVFARISFKKTGLTVAANDQTLCGLTGKLNFWILPIFMLHSELDVFDQINHPGATLNWRRASVIIMLPKEKQLSQVIHGTGHITQAKKYSPRSKLLGRLIILFNPRVTDGKRNKLLMNSCYTLHKRKRVNNVFLQVQTAYRPIISTTSTYFSLSELSQFCHPAMSNRRQFRRDQYGALEGYNPYSRQMMQ